MFFQVNVKKFSIFVYENYMIKWNLDFLHYKKVHCYPSRLLEQISNRSFSFCYRWVSFRTIQRRFTTNIAKVIREYLARLLRVVLIPNEREERAERFVKFFSQKFFLSSNLTNSSS